MRISTGSLLRLLLGGCLFVGFGLANRALLDQPRPRLDAEIEVGLPIPAQILVAGGDRYLAATLGTVRVLVADTQKMTPEEFALQGRLQSDVAWLNPANEDNIYIAAAILPWNSQLDAAQYVLKRASDARPFDWQPPFYVAFNEYFFVKNPIEAARWLKRAGDHSQFEDEKLDFQQIAALWAAKAPDLHVAIRVHRELIQSTKHREFAVFLERRIVRLENLLSIDDAQSNFRAENGRGASQIEELVRSGVLLAVPEDPLGMTYVLSADGRAAVVPRVDGKEKR